MSETGIPETEEEAEQKRKELIKKTKEKRQELDRKQNEALEAIKGGGDLEDYQLVELGDLEIEVKAWMPGDVADTVQKAHDIGQSGDMERFEESIQTMLSALVEMTTDDTYNMAFWQAYYQEYGPEGVLVAAETIIGPAAESMEAKSEGVKSFRGDKPR